MTKRWTQVENRAGRSVSPDLFNQELRAQQSAITTIDRTQLPQAVVDEARLVDYALHQVWHDNRVGTTGEQENEVDTNVPTAAWRSSTIQTSKGGWRTLVETTLTGFRGGMLFVEWSANVYVNNICSYGINDGRPGTPNYMAMRIVVNGINIGERRGGGYHQDCRIIGTQLFPPGDLSLTLQWRSADQSQDAASTVSSGPRLPYAHLWRNRWIAIARYR
jgi:hypothetical protein